MYFPKLIFDFDMGLTTQETGVASKLTLHLLIFDEGILIDSFCHITEEYFRSKSIAMVHYRLSIWTIPAIHY